MLGPIFFVIASRVTMIQIRGPLDGTMYGSDVLITLSSVSLCLHFIPSSFVCDDDSSLLSHKSLFIYNLYLSFKMTEFPMSYIVQRGKVGDKVLVNI